MSEFKFWWFTAVATLYIPEQPFWLMIGVPTALFFIAAYICPKRGKENP